MLVESKWCGAGLLFVLAEREKGNKGGVGVEEGWGDGEGGVVWKYKKIKDEN